MKYEWHVFCCGGRVTPMVFRTKKAAWRWLEKYGGCDGPGSGGHYVRVERKP